MGMLSIHCDAIWTEEFTCDILPYCCRYIQGFYSKVSGCLYGRLNSLWIDQGPSGEPMTNVGSMLIVTDHTKLKEVHFLCSFWDVVGTYCLQARTVG